MEMDEYQRRANTTDQNYTKAGDQGLMIPLLGIAGETGTLLAEFKKKIRDRESYEGFNRRAEEELGDILWYLSCVASRLNLSLAEIASKNLLKTQERWPIEADEDDLFQYYDSSYPTEEQFPRLFEVGVKQDAATKKVSMWLIPDGKPLGDALTDNAYEDDGYRFHDVFHLAHLAVLGWSPVMRKLLNVKRKSDTAVDEVEDGARSAILEELIVAFVYSNARERKYYANIKHVDSEMLSTVKALVSHIEVHTRKMKDWENAIFQGYKAFRFLVKHKKGRLTIDMAKHSLSVERL